MAWATSSCPEEWPSDVCSGQQRSSPHCPSSSTRWPEPWWTTSAILTSPSWMKWTVPSCSFRPSPSATTTALDAPKWSATISSGWRGCSVWSKATLMTSWPPWDSRQTTASSSPARPSTCWSLCREPATALKKCCWTASIVEKSAGQRTSQLWVKVEKCSGFRHFNHFWLGWSLFKAVWLSRWSFIRMHDMSGTNSF